MTELTDHRIENWIIAGQAVCLLLFTLVWKTAMPKAKHMLNDTAFKKILKLMMALFL